MQVRATCIYAGFEVVGSVTVTLVDLATIQVAVSVAIMQLEVSAALM